MTRSKTGWKQVLRLTVAPRETIDDPVLASWLLDASWAGGTGPWARTFAIWRCPERPARAWLVRASDIPRPGVLDDWSGDPRGDPGHPPGRPSRWSRSPPRPEEWTISVDADEPAWVIVSQLADPQWKARWIGRRRTRPSTARSCRPSEKVANAGAGSVSRFLRRAAGRYDWSTTRATSRGPGDLDRRVALVDAGGGIYGISSGTRNSRSAARRDRGVT